MKVKRSLLITGAAGALVLAGLSSFAVQAVDGQRAVNTAIGSSGAAADAAALRDSVTGSADARTLLAHPLFDGRGWSGYVAAATAKNVSETTAARVHAGRAIDAAVWVPDLNSRYAQAVDAGFERRITGVERAQLDAIITAEIACSAHQAGRTDSEVAAEVRQLHPQPVFAEIAAYSIRVCPDTAP